MHGIYIDFMLMDAVEVLALVSNNGLFLAHKYGYQECCQVRKVTPLWRTLKSLLTWIIGLKDQSPGSRVGLPVVQLDPLFEGREYGGIGSLLKWNAGSNVDNQEPWSFLKAIKVRFKSIPFHIYVSDSQLARNSIPEQYCRGGVRERCGGGRIRTEAEEHMAFNKNIYGKDHWMAFVNALH